MIRSAVLTLLFLAGSIVLAMPNAAAQGGNTLARPDSVGFVGFDAVMTLNSTGNPVIAYADHTNDVLKVLVCGNPSCTVGNVITEPIALSDGTIGASIVLDSNDDPVIAYLNPGTGELNVLHCGDTTCSTANTVTSPDPGIDSGRGRSMALDASGNPVIAHFESGSTNLRIVSCGDATCATGNAVSNPDTSGDITGESVSLVLNSSGNPVVAYRDSTNADIRLLTCGDIACSTGNTISSPVTAGDVGSWIVMVLDASGNPVIAHRNDSGAVFELELLRCVDPACVGAISVSSPDPGTQTSGHTALALNAAGNPVIAHNTPVGGDLVVVVCGDPVCSANNTVTRPDTAASTGAENSIALDGSGNPIVSYRDATNSDLRVLHCGDAFCTPTLCDGVPVSMDLETNPYESNGTEEHDVIRGSVGDDTINGKGGDDIICARDGADTVRGGAGADTIYGGPGQDDLMGGGGADAILGGDDNDTIDGQGGTDTLVGGRGNDTIDGRGAADEIFGQQDDDTIAGHEGADIISGGAGLDDLSGQTGPDTFYGGNHDDDMRGGEGADTLYGGPGVDKCSGNTGPDEAEAATCETTPGVEVLF